MKRVLVPVALVATLVAAGCVAPVAEITPNALTGVDTSTLSAPVFEDGFAFGFLDAVVDPTLTLHAETFLPLTDKPLVEGAPEKFPTILVMSPYFGAGQNGNAPGHSVYGYLVNELVPRGYAVVLADTAGTGGSSGCWDFMGPNEVRGVAAMIDAIAAQPWSDGQVGMIGKSYDGMTQIMAAATNPAALKTIVPVAPLTQAYAGLFMNGIHYGGGWHVTTTGYHIISASPPMGSEERYPGYVVRTIETPTCVAQNTALGNDPSGSYNAYFQERDFRPTANAVQPSVFFMQGFRDPAVKPDNMFPWFHDVPGPKKAWIGHWDHDYANATWAGREDMFLTIHRWFDHELKGMDNGILDEPVYDVQDSQGRWRREMTWPPADATVISVPLADATIGGPTAALGGTTARLELGLEGSLHIAGMPRLALALTSDRPAGYVTARLMTEESEGPRLVARGATSLLHPKGPGSSPTPVTPMSAVNVVFDLYPTDFAVLDATKLWLELDTTDPTGWFTPDASLATLTLDGAASVLELPTIERSDEHVFLVACGKRIKDAVPSCYREDARDLGVDA